MTQHNIGEIITLPDGRRAEVVRCNGLCSGCIFLGSWGNCTRHDLKCIGHTRSDQTDIIYKEIKEEIDMENIFKGAKFGDKFKTKDGRCAVLVNWGQFRECVYLYVEERHMEFYGQEVYTLDGIVAGGSRSHDIIGRWEE